MSWANIVSGVSGEVAVNSTSMARDENNELLSTNDFPTLDFSSIDGKKIKSQRYVPKSEQLTFENPTSTLTRTLNNIRNNNNQKKPENENYKNKVTKRPPVKNPFKGRRPVQNNDDAQNKPRKPVNGRPPRGNVPAQSRPAKVENTQTESNSQSNSFKEYYKKLQQNRGKDNGRFSRPENNNRNSKNNHQYNNRNNNRGDNRNNNQNNNQNGNYSQSRHPRTTLDIFGDREPQEPREDNRLSYATLIQRNSERENHRSANKVTVNRALMMSDFL